MTNPDKSLSPAAQRENTTVSPADAAELAAHVFAECFTGAEDFGPFGTFIDAGFMELLAGLNAQEASTPVAGASIATHMRHTSFALDVYAQGISGNKPGTFLIDWAKDWETDPVNGKQWQALQENLASQLESFTATMRQQAAHSGYRFRTAIAALAHTAFHLGAIQVKFDELKAGK